MVGLVSITPWTNEGRTFAAEAHPSLGRSGIATQRAFPKRFNIARACRVLDRFVRKWTRPEILVMWRRNKMDLPDHYRPLFLWREQKDRYDRFWTLFEHDWGIFSTRNQRDECGWCVVPTGWHRGTNFHESLTWTLPLTTRLLIFSGQRGRQI